MNTYDYKIGKLNGMLKAFEWVNSKCNHGYSFAIETLAGDDDLKNLAANHLKQWYPNATVNSKPVADWRNEFSKMLQEWLFEYVLTDKNTSNPSDKLREVNGSFTLFYATSRESFTNDFCDALEDAIGVIEIIEVNIETDEWYEAYWHDFAFKGRNGNVFIHLGVSD